MKLLLIMPRFFNYPEVITDELKEMGYEVDFWDDRPSTNALVKAAIRINKNIIYKYIERYFNEIMKTVRTKKYDIVFLISGQSLSFWDLPYAGLAIWISYCMDGIQPALCEKA